MTVYSGFLSPEAEKRKEEAAMYHRYQWRHMRAGPYISKDGITVVIPAEEGYYKPKANAFYRQVGFHWDQERHVWLQNGQTAAGATRILAAIGPHYRRLWPNLLPLEEQERHAESTSKA